MNLYSFYVSNISENTQIEIVCELKCLLYKLVAKKRSIIVVKNFKLYLNLHTI